MELVSQLRRNFLEALHFTQQAQITLSQAQFKLSQSYIDLHNHLVQTTQTSELITLGIQVSVANGWQIPHSTGYGVGVGFGGRPTELPSVSTSTSNPPFDERLPMSVPTLEKGEVGKSSKKEDKKHEKTSVENPVKMKVVESNAPEEPASAYLLWVIYPLFCVLIFILSLSFQCEIQGPIQALFPNLTSAEINRKVGERWNSMTDEQKDV
jgi:hypothetical protein